jgi:hypothetical protein
MLSPALCSLTGHLNHERLHLAVKLVIAVGLTTSASRRVLSWESFS